MARIGLDIVAAASMLSAVAWTILASLGSALVPAAWQVIASSLLVAASVHRRQQPDSQLTPRLAGAGGLLTLGFALYYGPSIWPSALISVLAGVPAAFLALLVVRPGQCLSHPGFLGYSFACVLAVSVWLALLGGSIVWSIAT